MSILSNIFLVMLIGLYGFIICHSIWELYKSFSPRNKGLYPLTGTQPESDSNELPTSPLTNTELVNVTRSSVKKQGGK